jgi:hypothetical protein
MWMSINPSDLQKCHLDRVLSFPVRNLSGAVLPQEGRETKGTTGLDSPLGETRFHVEFAIVFDFPCILTRDSPHFPFY